MTKRLTIALTDEEFERLQEKSWPRKLTPGKAAKKAVLDWSGDTQKDKKEISQTRNPEPKSLPKSGDKKPSEDCYHTFRWNKETDVTECTRCGQIKD